MSEEIREKQNSITESLPVIGYTKEIKEIILSADESVIVGETGSGKTTRIPLMLLDLKHQQGWKGKIAVTQPRRLATRSVSKYVADQVGCQIGEEVGYRIRFDDQTSEGTEVSFVTDGILLHAIRVDPLLREYSAVMVDEAHERSLNIDFLLGLLKRCQVLRAKEGIPSLKIVVTSATIEKEKFSSYFNNCPTLEIPGRLFPVEEVFLPSEDRDLATNYPEKAAQTARDFVNGGGKGDILIFMPGWDEIQKTIASLNQMDLGAEILPLHSELSAEDQDRIFKPSNKRKIIVSTNIAETSVTVPGITCVIDSGYIKQKEYNPSSGIESLVTEEHAKSGLKQRAGRAGRVRPGVCYHLFTKENYEQRLDYQVPEIQRSNLEHVVLVMKKMGIDNIEDFEFIDPPGKEAISAAIENLKILGALDENENITKDGELMAELGLEPKLGRMVIEARKYNCVDEVCTIAAFFKDSRVFQRPKGKETEADVSHRKFKVSDSDFLGLLKLWEEYQKIPFDQRWEWAKANFVNGRVLEEISKIRYELFRVLRQNGVAAFFSQGEKGITDDEEKKAAIGKSITAGLIGNLLVNQGRWSYQRVFGEYSLTVFGRGEIYIHPSSVVFDSYSPRNMVVCSGIKETSKTYAFTIQEVKPEWLKEIIPHLIERIPFETYYDRDQDQVKRKFNLTIKNTNIKIETGEESVFGEEAVRVFSQRLLSDIGRNYAATFDRRKELFYRSNGKIPSMPNRDDFLQSFFYTKLLPLGVSSYRQLNEAISGNKIDLSLNLDDLVSPEEQELITKEVPAEIEINGVLRGLNWGIVDQRGGNYLPHVEISPNELVSLKEVPVLPDGRQIIIIVSDKESFYESGTDLEELKIICRERYRKTLFERYVYSVPQRADETLPALKPVVYGTDLFTKEDLIAYPAYRLGWSSVTIVYSLDSEEARQLSAETLERINQARRNEGKPEVRTEGVSEQLVPKEEPRPEEKEEEIFEVVTDQENEEKPAVAEEEEKKVGIGREKIISLLGEAEKKIALQRSIVRAKKNRILQGKEEESGFVDTRAGEVNIPLDQVGTRLVVKLSRRDLKGNFYADVVAWGGRERADFIFRLIPEGNVEGTMLVEVIGKVDDGKFLDKELGIEGKELKVREVDLEQEDEKLQQLLGKQKKLQRKLEQKSKES